MDDYTKDMLISLGSFTILAFAVAGALGLVAGLASNAYGAYQCSSYSEATGLETKWNHFDSCYIWHAEAGRFLAATEFQARQTAQNLAPALAK